MIFGNRTASNLSRRTPMNSNTHKPKSSIPFWLDHLLTFLLIGYKKIVSPVFGNACRFHPSCSEYGVEAIRKHGLLKGLWLAARRVFRCNPLSGMGGDDPVP